MLVTFPTYPTLREIEARQEETQAPVSVIKSAMS